MEMNRNLITKFAEVFGPRETSHYFSPGRINLIGEHTDYNGGHVFPASITYGTYSVASPREDKKVLVYSTNFDELGVISFSLDDLSFDKNADWANYVKGMILKTKEMASQLITGLNCW